MQSLRQKAHPADDDLRGADVMGYAMRTDRHRYVKWRHRGSGEVLARDLYDHAEDGEENRTIAADAARSAAVAENETDVPIGE